MLATIITIALIFIASWLLVGYVLMKFMFRSQEKIIFKNTINSEIEASLKDLYDEYYIKLSLGSAIWPMSLFYFVQYFVQESKAGETLAEQKYKKYKDENPERFV